jgi:hypothetical protein
MGRPGNPGRHHIPVDEKEGTILDIKMDRNTSQRLLAPFDDMLVGLILDEEASGCDDIERKSWTQIFGILQIILLQCHTMMIFQKSKLYFGRRH